MEQNDSQFFLKCSSFSESQLLSLNLTLSIVGLVSSVISAIILVLLIFYKAYKSVLQRLFLYLMVTTLARQLGISASFEHRFQYEAHIQEEICKWIGFFCNWTSKVEMVFTVAILTYILYLVYRLAKGYTVPQFLQPTVCRRTPLECTFVTLSVVLSFAYACIPFIDNNYGLAGAWCWIKSMDDNCTAVGVRDQILSEYIFTVTGGFFALVLIATIVTIYWKLPRELKEAKLLLKKTLIMLVFSLFPIAARVMALSFRVYTATISDYQVVGIWYAQASVFPISQQMFQFGFLICFYPIKMFSCQSLKQVIKKWKCYFLCCCCRGYHGIQHKRTSHYQTLPADLDLSKAKTIRKSTRVSAPSYTFFNISHSHDFTQSTHPAENRDYGSIAQHEC